MVTRHHTQGSIDAGIGRQSALATARLMAEAVGLNNTRIRFAHECDPKISIVIVSYNSRDLLCMTLVNLANHVASDKAKFEVIIVDNNSNGDTRDLLDRVENATIVLNEFNEGFGPACNRGAALANGRFILFLNPDIDLMPGALDALIDGFEYFDNTGIVGARLVFPGGILQEAGAFFVDDDQLTHPYLRGNASASAPEALFAREVGYVSGAVLLIEKTLFEVLGGFDKAFAPAYFEDTDLCLRASQLGRKVVYQPRAIALHYENATSPSRESVEILLKEHRKVLLDRHRNWLFESGAHPAGFMQREPDRHKFRVLYIDDQTPHIDRGAGLPRANSIVNLMVSLGYFVTILPLYGSDSDPVETYRDLDPRIEILNAEAVEGLKRVIDERPIYYDLMWVSRPHNIDLVVKTFLSLGVSIREWVTRRVIFDTEALFSVREAILGLKDGKSIESHKLLAAVKAETEFAYHADSVVCVSNSEKFLLEKMGGVLNTKVLGHSMNVNPGPASFEERNGVVFIGPLNNEGTPNVDSIDWFLDTCWPTIVERLGERAQLLLVGDIDSKIRLRFERPNVSILGRVNDVQSIFNSVRLSIAPTRFAAGIPQKVHNCVAHGVPMVVSPLLKAQLGWEDLEGCVSAALTDPEQFAKAVVELHEVPDLWQQVRDRGITRIIDECDEGQFRLALRNICEGKNWV